MLHPIMLTLKNLLKNICGEFILQSMEGEVVEKSLTQCLNFFVYTAINKLIIPLICFYQSFKMCLLGAITGKMVHF